MCNTVPRFHGFLTGKSINSNILVIEGHLQGHIQPPHLKINFRICTNMVEVLCFNHKKHNCFIMKA